MQYQLVDLIKENHIIVGVEAETAEEAIRIITQTLENDGYVNPQYAYDVWLREQTFPTGLPTQPTGIAIPHADADNVIKSAITIGILKRPVSFSQMGTDGSTTVSVQIIFVLAIKEREKQVDMISQLVRLIQSPELLSSLLQVKNAKEVVELINRSVK